MKLTKRDIKKWVKALRSGEYRQGSGQLCKDDDDGNPKFCCLGVACDLFLEGYWEPEANNAWRIDGRHCFPPDALGDAIDAAIYGMDDDGITCDCSALANMNDDGKSFSEIADYIEKCAGLR